MTKIENLLSNLWFVIEKIIEVVFFLMAILFHIKLNDDKKKNIIQFVKFGLVGISNTVISYLTYVFVCFMGFSFHVGNVCGFVVSVLNSFYWNNKYVFAKGMVERKWWKALIKTFISYAFSGLLLTELLLMLWIDEFGLSKFLAPLINLIITIPTNFLLNKLWAFK